MGGGPTHETLLFIFQEPEPTPLTNKLRAQFPHITLIYHQLSRPTPGKLMGGIPYAFDKIPDDLWSRTTILVTLGTLPPDPKLAPNLKLIHLLSAGVDHFTKHPIFTDTDIPITTVSGIHGPAISEWVLMTALNLAKNYNVMHDNQKAHRWDSKSTGLMRRSDWQGKTVGIAGYGSIGRQVARVFNAMGSNVHAYTSSARSTAESRRDTGYVIPGTGDPEGKLPSAWYSGTDKTGLHTFLVSGLDVLVVCVPLTDSTRGLLGREEMDVLFRASLEKAKGRDVGGSGVEEGKLPDGEGCILVNIARGAVIQTDALIAALKEGKLQGAALDVTDPEPLPEDSELWDLPNAIVTPHVSGLFSGYLERGLDVLVENLRRRERGEKLVNEINRKKGYRSAET
ncbi:hypothetical protein PMZ80_007197 [Knufia obscura]|uniref:D-isomer specific 2-hydroxyacid dehydrogenase NAD-binding domain-containing protein n=1 Tax=Knufia obscura TaxID=1635080 RepID=A0ABR0RJJ4_9EURO|nr:hypothetical protein PMZ80_007197 [Knufia obscura]